MTTSHTIIKGSKRYEYIGGATKHDNSRRAVYRDEDGKQYQLTLNNQSEALKRADGVLCE